MKPLLALAVVACVTSGCSRTAEPPVLHVARPPPVAAPLTEHRETIPAREPVAHTLERAKWHADYAAGLIEAHRSREQREEGRRQPANDAAPPTRGDPAEPVRQTAP